MTKTFEYMVEVFKARVANSPAEFLDTYIYIKWGNQVTIYAPKQYTNRPRRIVYTESLV